VLSPGPGDRVRVHPLVAAESGGFWHLWSVGWQRRAPERYRRVYLPIAPPGALEVVGRIAATAPPRHIWAMKALSGVHDGGRRDGAVLYLPSRAPLETGWVADAVAGVRPWCVERLPPFVAPLPSPAGTAELPWAGWAPDPGGGRSFGEEVCEAVAVAAASTGDPDRFMDAALRAVAALPGMRSSPVALVRRPRR
jgi:hypothetical protein